MSRRLTTRSGTVYELNHDGSKVRRIPNGHPENAKRGDGAWLRLHAPLPFNDLTGLRLLLELEPLAALGPDDSGVRNLAAPATQRVTSPVIIDSWHADSNRKGVQ